MTTTAAESTKTSLPSTLSSSSTTAVRSGTGIASSLWLSSAGAVVSSASSSPAFWTHHQVEEEPTTTLNNTTTVETQTKAPDDVFQRTMEGLVVERPSSSMLSGLVDLGYNDMVVDRSSGGSGALQVFGGRRGEIESSSSTEQPNRLQQKHSVAIYEDDEEVTHNRRRQDDDDYGGTRSGSTAADGGGNGGSDVVSFWHDFVAGGLAGSASVIVGHPLDSMKVRIQAAATSSTTTASSSNLSMMASITEFGGIGSLFRGMGPPLYAASLINAVVFGSYALSSRLWDEYIVASRVAAQQQEQAQQLQQQQHDPWNKAFACGAFAGFVQCIIICPMEHIKCRLQVQHGVGCSDHQYSGPGHAIRSIIRQHGIQRLYQGWYSTLWREVPAFGLYFAAYDALKDKTIDTLQRLSLQQQQRQQHQALSSRQRQLEEQQQQKQQEQHYHAWIASATAGGISGALTWGIVYPVDVIKTKIQTSSLSTPYNDLSMIKIANDIIRRHGYQYLFRGLNITLLRAFPVNATIFPVYEFTLQQISSWSTTTTTGGR